MEENALRPVFSCRLLAGICALAGLVLIVWFSQVKLLVVHGDSMYPTLVNGQHAVAYRTNYDQIEKGDMVVIYLSEISEHYIVKRVIGLQGDLVEIDGQTLYVNGDLVKENLGEAFANISTTVGTGQLYLLGDNQGDSYDSRYFGPVKSDSPIYVIGVAI